MINSPNNGENTPPDDEDSTPLCVHLRAWRGWRRLTKEELARQTGLSLARLHYLETCRELTLTDWQGNHLDRLAKALEIPLTVLIAQPAKQHIHGVLAVCLRGGVLGLVVVVKGEVITMQRLDLGARQYRGQRTHLFTSAIESICQDYNLKQVVLEPDSLLATSAKRLDLTVHRMTLKQAKATLMGEGHRVTHYQLSTRLLTMHPNLKTGVGDICARELTQGRSWRICVILATALGLAFQKHRQSPEKAAPTASLQAHSPVPCSTG